MKKGIIVYKSKYGSTKKYAQWLSKSTGFDYIEIKKLRQSQLQAYDTIILGGAIYASGIAGLSLLKKNIKKLKTKKIIVYCVGASPYDENAFEQIYSHNFKDSLSDIACFYCRGAWDEDKMTFIDRKLCKTLQKVVAKKAPSNYEPWEAALMYAVGQKCDWTDEKYLAPVLEHLNL